MAKNNIKGNFKQKQTTDRPVPGKPATLPKNKTDYSLAIAVAIVVTITFVVFVPSLSLGFVNWDDPFNLLENETLKAFATHWDWASVKAIFTTDVIGNYNPLPIFTFAIEKYLFAPNPLEHPFFFHVNNVWMHVVCTLFVFLIFTELGLGRIAAVIGALLFGIHPMRVESVAWITERKDVLYGLFFLASLYAYIRYTRNDAAKTKWYAFALLLSVFSYFSKVQAVTLPLSMVAVDFYLNRNWKNPKTLIAEKMPWWLLSMAFGLINIYFLKRNNSLSSSSYVVDYSFIDKLAVGAYSYAIYLLKWIYPYKMSPLYPYSPELPMMAYICLAIVPIAVLAFMIWSFRQNKKQLLFGWAFFTFNVMFLLQIVGAGQGFLADRFTYIAYIGLFFIMASFYEWLAQQKPSSKLAIQIGFGLYLALFAFLTSRQQKIWENGGTLWEKVKLFYPNSPLAWKQAANYYRDEKKDLGKAIENYKSALALQPEDAFACNDLAKAYTDSAFAPGMLQQTRNEMLMLALQTYNDAVKYDSIVGQPDKKTSGEIFVNRGAAYAILGNLDKALPDLNKGLQINPNNLNGYANRAILYTQINRYDLSLKDRDAYIALNPDNPDIHYERGVCKINLGRTAEALPDFDKAIALNNTKPIYYIGRAQANKLLGNMNAVSADIGMAKQLGASIPPDLLK